MARKVKKHAVKTHDVYAAWTDGEGIPRNLLVGLRSFTDGNESIEILFKDFPKQTATITAIPLTATRGGQGEAPSDAS
ncbi:hypothetical protein QCN27_15665 [Cereibacter sp. SYSU M97828]|nr:hypothetical protein [Cereibacter flavus]